MTAHVSEVIRGWLGCHPNTHMIKAKNSDDTGLTTSAGNRLAKSPGPSGAGRSRKPGEGLYERTQRGTLIIGAVTAAIIVILVTTYMFGIVWVTIFVLGIMIAALAIFSTLTVSVSNDALQIRFGPVGLVRKRWPMAEIASVTTVTNPWYYGWGIHWTPHGTLYNVSGCRAIEVRLLSGKTFRIGTDEPEALKTAIEQARTDRNKASHSTG